MKHISLSCENVIRIGSTASYRLDEAKDNRDQSEKNELRDGTIFKNPLKL